MTEATDGLRALLNPRAVAVVGASERQGNRGGTAAGYLKKFGFTGEVYVVHPSGESVEGFPAFRSIGELPPGVDVAVLGLGAERVPGAITELGAAGIPGAIVWAGGFAETGHPGMELQERLALSAREAQVRVIGPNCLGVVNTATRFTGTFATWLRREARLLSSGISIVSQSGGLAAFAHAWSQEAGVGFRYMVSTGNAADVSLIEVLDQFIADDETTVILCYLEGTSDGPALLDALHRAREAQKPVVMLKVGHSQASASAIAAHTGALAGETRVWDALLAAEGVIQVRSVEELLEVAHFLHSRAGRPRLQGNRVAILGFGGGMGVLAADQAGSAGLEVPPLSPKLQTELRRFAPEIASVANPLDLTPEAFNQAEWRARIPQLLEALDASGEVDVIMTQFQTGESVYPDEVAGAVAQQYRTGRSATVIYSRGAGERTAQLYREAGAHTFFNQKSAIDTVGLIATARQSRRAAQPAVAGADARTALAADFEAPAVADGTVLPEHEVQALLASAGFSTLEARAATTRDEAIEIAEALGFPVVAKGLSTKVTHRAVAGLVRLGLGNAREVAAAWDSLQERGREIDAELVGILIEQQATGGTELLVSAITDPVFGPVISVGAGGVLTELLDDVSFARGPLDIEEAFLLLSRLRISTHAKGIDLATTGMPAAEFLVKFSQLVAALPWRSYVIELNPVIVDQHRALPLDGLLIVQDATRAAGTPTS